MSNENEPNWVVNDSGELGVEVGGRVFFLYKGESLEYTGGTHDDGTEMLYRPVGKREFGECCHPVDGYWVKCRLGLLRRPATPWRTGEGWKPVPAATVSKQVLDQNDAVFGGSRPPFEGEF